MILTLERSTSSCGELGGSIVVEETLPKPECNSSLCHKEPEQNSADDKYPSICKAHVGFPEAISWEPLLI